MILLAVDPRVWPTGYTQLLLKKGLQICSAHEYSNGWQVAVPPVAAFQHTGGLVDHYLLSMFGSTSGNLGQD